MGISEEYRRQLGWRDWPAVFRRLPPVEGHTVLDVGCGVGDQAALLAERGARVIGVDLNEELLETARSRGIPNAEFHLADLGKALDVQADLDGVWSSFSAAYFTDLPRALSDWTKGLRSGGWILVVEIDDLFGHGPLAGDGAELVAAYERESLAAGRYDFHMGSKLSRGLTEAGLRVETEFTVDDTELAFQGPADPEVLEAWRDRLARMRLLRAFCGAAYERFEADFLACLSRPDHHATARVCGAFARRA